MPKDKESLKKVNIELIQPGRSPYRFLKKMRTKYHPEIRKAKIALAWRQALKPDRDGHLILGMCHRMSDLSKELAEYDYVILLNKEVWNDEKFDKKKKYALMDHELCHAAAVFNKSGKQKKDERGRYVWRIRDHDIEEFRDVVDRHGCYKRDLELFAEALLKRKRRKG